MSGSNHGTCGAGAGLVDQVPAEAVDAVVGGYLLTDPGGHHRGQRPVLRHVGATGAGVVDAGRAGGRRGCGRDAVRGEDQAGIRIHRWQFGQRAQHGVDDRLHETRMVEVVPHLSNAIRSSTPASVAAAARFSDTAGTPSRRRRRW